MQDRLKKLESSGVIAGYAVRLGDESRLKGIGAMISLSVEPRRQTEVARTIARMPAVETLYTVSGKHDFVVLLRAETADAVDGLLDQFASIPGVTDIETSVILSTKVDRR